ncbi:allophanate hydrolase subunit 2 [Actibacterium atlanticum]|uniref:Allophanate hydrolase subunit 2 n=1 Tax=Actibacterium atlanticum TaxID=1461693 RepID=A0A058ZLU4_9RHOB|nr:biotin-dependent carboxyltransferase family protein [Actibacterium atlanticum]KCV81746.1 allophanate hydrolase subunit 2 [Actibacterium atlanticum]
MTVLTLEQAGPALRVQDLGRPGYIAQGVAPGGAADPLALLEAAALLDVPAPLPALEMAGVGGRFTCSAPMRFALTGAPMRAHVDGARIGWSETQLLLPGQVLEIGAAEAGVYGYLTPAGGVQDTPWLDSFSTFPGEAPLASGAKLTLGDDSQVMAPPKRLKAAPRFSGGMVRVMPGPQTGLFAPETLTRVQRTLFTRSARANRQGVRLEFTGAPFEAQGAAGLASDFITAGDVQITGDGAPYVLLAECQTIGGYPRLGTVIPADLPKLAQAPMGAALQLQLIDLAQADALWQTPDVQLKQLRAKVAHKTRDPHAMRDLLSYQLISGVTRGDEEGI